MTFHQTLGLCMISCALGGAAVNLVYVTLFRRIARKTKRRNLRR